MTRGPGRPPRLDVIFPSGNPPVFFVTICTAQRRRCLDNDAVHHAFQQFARRGQQQHHIAVGRYVIMPDHLHLFVCGPPEFDLSQWVRLLKRAVTEGPGTWQRGFFDHLLRSDESYGQKWEYVRQNPVRAGLVVRPEDWPYRGLAVSRRDRRHRPGVAAVAVAALL
jgi:putative transposase